MKTKNSKWFYPAQEKIKNYLNEKFGENYSCNFQDVCEHTVHENYMVRKEGEDAINIHFVVHRGPTTNSPDVIHTYYQKYEDTMQYFQE